MSDIDRLLTADLVDDIEFLVARTRSLGTAAANAQLASLGLKVRAYSVLSLAGSDLKPSQRELADFLSLDASQIVALVDELEGRGLVSRELDSRDRRSNAITATAAGRAVLADARAAINAAESTVLGALTPEQREALRALLRTVAFDSGS